MESLREHGWNAGVKDITKAPEREQAEGTEEEGSKNDGMGNIPSYSLAGSGAQNPNNNRGYADEEYVLYNPQYGKGDDGPIWGLAQPLPHIVRPGMRHGALPEDRKEDKSDIREDGQDLAQSDEVRKQQSAEKRMKKVNDPKEDGFFNSWSKTRHYLREPLAEWLGTTMAMTIGLCATLSNFISSGKAGSYPAQSAAWGFGFMTAIYTTGGMSGGHLNPAITISLSVFRGFPARRCVIYIAAQLLGAITAGGISYAIYHDAIVEVANLAQLPQNASVAAQALLTLPKSFVRPATAFFTESVGSAILVGSILALGDDTNAPPGAGMQAFIIGIIVTILILAFGYNSAGCFNCVRDFGPRLVVLMAGWGGNVFKEYRAWWIWGPWVADITGALFGAMIYDLAIFTGGESPVNYPPRRRKRAYRMRALNIRKKLRIGKRKVPDLERSVADTER
ncbi:hypothetical protein E8E15_001154 [Penicillium rubens]|nr:hypothetical protein E8E15_001154 [Penicillium rubens]KAJ5051222.1 hypothetical protein NUH16_003418 [Penicillium rubens]